MDDRLLRLIRDYQSRVAESLILLERAGIRRPGSALEWVVDDVPQRGELGGGARYFKHGYGCAVQTPEWSVDFDFGEHDGRTDGFDAWRLKEFAGDRLSAYGFASTGEIDRAFDAAKASGELVHSGYILWFLRDEDPARPTSSDR